MNPLYSGLFIISLAIVVCYLVTWFLGKKVSPVIPLLVFCLFLAAGLILIRQAPT
ncbi:MAG: hypothetical protein AAF978_05095 [Cyanobacteria bacterium P01_E01_bin.48]